jgi:general secretion pathway protein D
VHGFTAVKAGSLYKIVKISDAASRAIPTIVGTAAESSRDPDEVITQIIPVRFSNVNDLRSLLQPLISQQRGNVIAHRETNILIVTDTASNISRLLDIVQLVDVEVALEDVQIIPLQYADASETAQILTQIFASGRLRTAGAPGGPPPAPARPGVPQAAAQPAGESPTERPPLILPERRSNALVIHARRNELITIRSMIAKLDVSLTGGRRVFIYYAENAKAKDLAATMNAIYGAPTTPGGAQPGAPPGGAPRPGPGAPGYTPPSSPTARGVGAAEVGFAEGQFRFIPDETTNAIVLATYPRLWTDVEQTLKQLDRSPRQVLIEVLVAEITLRDDTRLGLEWALREGRFDFSSAPGLGSNTAGTLQARPSYRVPPLSAVSTLAGFNAFTFATDRFFAALNAFAAQNLLNVLSSPSIMTSENKKAVINVSQSIPIVTSQQIPFGGTVSTTGQTTTQPSAAVVGTQTVEYRDAGVILTVTPRIGERGTVALDVKQEVNDVGEAIGPTNSPSIIKREAETAVVLLNNQTLVLGGLIRDRRGATDRGIPWLHKIPVLGYLFGAKITTTEKTELLILITPRVIGTAEDAAKTTDAFRKSSPEYEKSFQKAVPLPPTSPGTPAPLPTPIVPPPVAPSAPESQPAPPGPTPSGLPSSAPPPPQVAPVPEPVQPPAQDLPTPGAPQPARPAEQPVSPPPSR